MRRSPMPAAFCRYCPGTGAGPPMALAAKGVGPDGAARGSGAGPGWRRPDGTGITGTARANRSFGLPGAMGKMADVPWPEIARA
jgi:hypothetical protein